MTDSTPQPARLAAMGRSIDVTTARWASLLLLALAAVVGGAAVSVTRLAGGETEQERTRRRHGALLLPVLPIALPEGRPVIDVYDLGSLAKLAERHGLMVLWWSRSGVDTYVVQEESTTYRYRTGDRRDTDDTAAFGASDAASDTVVKDTRP